MTGNQRMEEPGEWRRHSRLTWWQRLRVPLAIAVILLAVSTYSIEAFFLGTLQQHPQPAYELPRLMWGAIRLANGFATALTTRPVPAQSRLEDLRLFIPRGSFEVVRRQPPDARSYVQAVLQTPDGRSHRVGYRLRGITEHHWLPEKPSIRIRMQRDDFYQGERYLELINPEDPLMAANFLSERIARHLGLLTRERRFVRLFINHKYFGVYHLVSRFTSLWLTHQRRLTGPIIESEGGEAMWQSPVLWRTEAKDPDRARRILGRLLQVLQEPPSAARVPRLWAVLDRDHLATWWAVMNLAGAIHTEETHNHLYYVDPSVGRLEPFHDGDVMGYISMPNFVELSMPGIGVKRLRVPYAGWRADVSIYERLQPILEAAMSDPWFLHMRNRILWDALHTVATPGSQHEYLDRLAALIRDDVYSDRFKGCLEMLPGGWFRINYPNWLFERSLRQAHEWIDARHTFLLKTLRDTSAVVAVRRTAERSSHARIPLRITVEGTSAVRLRPPPGSTVRLFADLNLDGVPEQDIHTELLLFPAIGEGVDGGPAAILPGRRVLRPAPADYRIDLEGVAPEAVNGALERLFQNAITGEALHPTVEVVDRFDPSLRGGILHPWAVWSPATVDIRHLGPGRVTLTRDLVISETEALVVQPGTTLRMAPGVSVLSRGRIRLEGTASAPIVVMRADRERPWGVIALQGAGAAGSRLQHVTVEGGSTAVDGFVTYTGMLSAHWVPDVSLSHCTFRRSSGSGDAVHLVHTTFEADAVQVLEVEDDGIDLDYSRGRIAGVTIRQAGGDLLDLSGSGLVVHQAELSGAGDKGISAGEGSQLELVDAEIRNARTGLACKNGSRCIGESVVLTHNSVAWHGYRHDEAYAGAGEGLLMRGTMAQSVDALVRLEDGARLRLVDVSQDAPVAEGVEIVGGRSSGLAGGEAR